MKPSYFSSPNLMALSLGIAVGGLCLSLGLIVAGAGHGWVSAFPFGILALFVTPIGFSRLVRFRLTSISGNFSFLALAVLLDLLLLWSTKQEGFVYFNKAHGIAIQWLVVWGVWQLAAVLTLVFFIGTKSEQPGLKRG